MSDRPSDSPPPVPGRLVRAGRGAAPTGWLGWLPGIATLRIYNIEWLRDDLVAGLVLTAVLVPVGIAYAVAAGVPAICGLYETIFGLLAYALFGPSRALVLGPDSSLVALILGVVAPLAGGSVPRAMALAAMMALLSGVLCLAAGLVRLGFVTELLSKPIRYGYMNGIALTVIVSQAPSLLGVTVDGAGIAGETASLVRALAQGRINGVALLLGVGTLASILLFARLKRLPVVLLAVAAATAAVAAFDLAASAAVPVLGPLTQGLPALALPVIAWRDIVPVLLGSFAVALISFADTSVLSRTYAARDGIAVDPNREMFALGISNVIAGLFQGIPVSASASRTPVAAAAGAKTQLAQVFGALIVAALLAFAPGVLANLPTAALAGVVIAAAIGLIEIVDLRRIYRIQRWEFWLSMSCMAAVAVFGAIRGIGLAILIAVIEFLWDGWRPYSAVLGRVDGMRGFHDVTRHPDARVIPGLVLFRWDAPLFFANAELFRDRILDAVAQSPTPVNWLVVGAEPVTSIDVTAADVMAELDKSLETAGIALCFAEMKDPVKDKLKRFGLFATIGERRFFATEGEAVDRYLVAHQMRPLAEREAAPILTER